MTLDDILKKLQRGREISDNITKKTGDVLNSVGWGLTENIVKPITKATYKTIDNYSARKKALEEKNPNMSSLDKYIEIKKDTEIDNVNNLLNYANKKADELSKNNILRGILLGANKKVNNEQAGKKIFMGGIIPNNFQLKDTIDERKYKSFTSEELQKVLDSSADEVAPNKLARGIGNLGYEGAKIYASTFLPSTLVYGTTGALEEYGRTDDPDKIMASGVKDAMYGTIMRGTSKIAKKGLTKIIPGVSEKVLPTIATNFGANYIGGAGASAITDVGYNLMTGEKNDPKQIIQNANKSGLMSGIIGGTTDTIRDVKVSKIKFNKDVNNAIENLQNINKQITEGDVSISKNPKIINKLLEKGQKEIENLSNNKYLMQDKKLKEAVDMLQKAYDTGHINEINIASNNFVGLLGTAEMNLNSTQQNKNIAQVRTENNDINTFIKRKNNIPISEEVQIKSDVANFSNQIDNIDKIKENDSLNVLSKTPKVYQDLGLNDLPMTITKNHTLWSMEKQDGNTHRHGIEKEILKQIPEALTKPLNIVKSGSRNDSIVAITELSNSNGDLIVVPIKVDGKSNVNQIEIDSNVLTSIYGKDNDYDGWMIRNQKMGRILYDKDDGIIKKYRDNPPRLQLPNDTISTINNIIQQDNNYVNSAQNSQKNVKVDKLKENKSAIPLSEEVQLKNDIDDFAKQVDNVKNGVFPKRDMLTLLSNTPKVLQDIGLNNYPITMTQRHLDTIMNADGKYKNANYHNLGEDIVKQLPKAIANPLDIVHSNTDKNSIVLTTYLADKNNNNNTVIASIKIDGKGSINDIRIDTNVMTSAYGKENYDNFMHKNIRQGNLLYDVDQGIIKKLSGQGSNYLDDSTSKEASPVQQLTGYTSTINNIIPRGENYVNNAENSQKSVKKIPNDDINTFIKEENNQMKNSLSELKKVVPIKEKTKTAIPIVKNTKEVSNLTNTNSIDYNTNKGMGDKNGRKRESNSGSLRKTEEYVEQRGSKSDIENFKGKSINSRHGENNIPQKKIDETLTDIKAKKNVIEYAESNKITELSYDLSKLNKEAQELGINLVLFNGKNGNEYIGLMKEKDMYLDLNENNLYLEDGTLKDRFYHEVFHYLKRNTSFDNEIKEIQYNILKNNKETINRYIEKKGYNVDDFSEEVKAIITEEILADYCAKHISGYDVDYGLPEEITYSLNQIIEDALVELKLNKRNIIKKDNGNDIKSFVKRQKNTISINKNNDNKNEFISPTIDKISESRTKNKVKVSELKDLLAQKIVNKGHTVDKLAKATNNPSLTHAYDRTLSAFAEGNYSIGEAQTNNNGEEIGKSIKDIFKPAEDKKVFKEFNDYLLNRHNIDRFAVEKSLYSEDITPEKSRKTIKEYEERYPEFKEWAEDVYNFNRNELQNIVDAGFIDSNSQEYLTNLYGNYVPTFRDIIETAKNLEDKTTGAKNPIKSAKGGTEKILNIKDAMAEQVIRNKKAIRMNELGLELAKSLGEKSILNPNVEITFSTEAIMSLGGDVVIYEGDKPIFTVFKNGQAKELAIGDDLYDSLKKDTIIFKIQNSKLNVVAESFSKATSFYKELLTTYNIGFAFNNAIKDFQDSFFNTKFSQVTYAKNYTKALYQIGTKGEYHKKYLANGGAMNTYFEYGTGVLKDTKNPVKKFVQKIQKVSEAIEEAPRLAEFISTLEKGGTISEGMYNAADITTNFKRGGEVAKAINKYGANFLNASIQGLDKTYRTCKGEKGWKGYAKLLMKAAIFSVMPSVLNHLLLRGDEDYEALPYYIKDEYYLFKMDNGKFLRIPKGRVISVMGSTARRFLEVSEGKGFDLEGLKNTAKKQLAPNNPFEDNIFAPIKAVATNKAWYGGDIVSSRLQKQLPKNQYDEKTDEISKWLGSIFNYSPKKINYLLDQYSGGIGDVVLPMFTPQAENNILEDKFTTDSVLKNKYVGEFYDKKDEFEKINNDISKTYQDEVKYKYLNSISEKIGKLYNQKRDVQMSNISDHEKKETVRDIQKEINWYAENALKNINGNMTEEQEWNMYIEEIFSDNIRKEDKSSDSLDAQYAVDNELCTKREYIDLYKKTKENKQDMPTIKYLKKMEEIGLDIENYVEYKINTKSLKSDKNEKGKVINASLNVKEAKAIMNMNISDKQKDLLFDITNKTDDKPSVKDLKKLNGDYLTYMQQSGKKNDKGVSQRDKYMMYVDTGISVKTLNKYYDEIGKIEGVKDKNGKTISGSKKRAIFKYINSLPLSAVQKKILFTKSNASYGKSYKREIFNYINKLPISKTRKQQIWKELYD